MASMFVRAMLVLVLACGLQGCGDGEDAPGRVRTDDPPAVRTEAPAVPDDAPLVVFLGDSLAAGMGLPASDAFPAVLQRRLVERGAPFRLVNAGVSGNTTAAGLARVDWVLRQAPAVVVVELGANDGFRGLSLEATEANLRAILAKVEAAGATPVLLGMRLPPNYGADYAEGFDALFPRIAEETGVLYVPFFMTGVAGVPSMNQDDGIHPTSEGHRRLALNLEDTFLGLLRE